MPCNDQTETLTLVVNHDDQLVSFQLHKISCGRTVGDASLLPYIEGKSVTSLMTGTVSDFVPDLHKQRRIEEFLLFKQYFSIRAALRVWTGELSGELQQPFVLEEVSVDPTSTQIRGEVAVNLISEEIRACGSCRSCKPLPKEIQSVADSLVAASNPTLSAPTNPNL